MRVKKIKFEVEDGSMFYVDANEDIQKLVDCLPKDIKFKKTSDVKTLQNKYFAMVSELARNTGTGYTKMEIHNLLKPRLFKEIECFPNLYTDNIPQQSTKHLTTEGWSVLIEQLRIVANDLFEGYVFEN